MKIVQKNNNVCFSDLKPQDVFVRGDRAFMRINNNGKLNAVALDTGETTSIDGSAEVVPKPNATLNLND